MPFTNRDRPRLIERMRGDDLLNEFKSAFDNDRRMFFEPSSWNSRQSSFPRGFPFDDDDEHLARFPNRRRAGSPSHHFGAASNSQYEEPAPANHSREKFPPEAYADGFPFGHAFGEPDPRRKRPNEAEPRQAPPTGLSHHGLRNTVPIYQQQRSEEPRPPRAMSAPPTNRPQRYVSSCQLPPMTPNNTNSAEATPQQQPQPAQAPQGNVRLIPIQVEGRDEPLVNSNIDTPSNFSNEQPQFEGRLPRDFGAFRKHSARFGQHAPPSSPPPQQQQQAQQPKTQPSQQQQPPETRSEATPLQQDKPIPMPHVPAEQPSHSDEPDHAAPPAASTPLDRVGEVQRDIDELANRVQEATPTSRCDKQYVYLDEMLTRQMLRLDNIDTEGQASVRQARKDAIRSIQRCISVLESKVPQEPMDVETSNNCQQSNSEVEPMSQDSASTEQPASAPNVEAAANATTSDPPA